MNEEQKKKILDVHDDEALQHRYFNIKIRTKDSWNIKTISRDETKE